MILGQSLTPASFALLCFVEIMSKGGIATKSVDYFKEKAQMLKAGYDAFGYLDIHHMRNIIEWHTRWHVGLPRQIEEHWKLEEEAYESLKAKGFEI